MNDKNPGKVTVEVCEERGCHCLFKLKSVDNPHWNIAYENESDKRTSRFGPEVGARGRAPAQAIKNEDHLHCGLYDWENAGDGLKLWEESFHTSVINGHQSRDGHHPEENVESCHGHAHQNLIELLRAVARKVELPHLGKSRGKGDEAENIDSYVTSEVDKTGDGSRNWVFSGLKQEEEEHCYTDKSEEEESNEETAIGFVALQCALGFVFGRLLYFDNILPCDYCTAHVEEHSTENGNG